jgi:hypothetical protein
MKKGAGASPLFIIDAPKTGHRVEVRIRPPREANLFNVTEGRASGVPGKAERFHEVKLIESTRVSWINAVCTGPVSSGVYKISQNSEWFLCCLGAPSIFWSPVQRGRFFCNIVIVFPGYRPFPTTQPAKKSDAFQPHSCGLVKILGVKTTRDR